MVFDNHTHAWGPDVEDHPWDTDAMVSLARSLPVADVYDADALLADMDAVGVDEAVVVGLPLPEWHDNWYTLKVAEEYDRLYGIVLADPFHDDAADRLRAEAAHEDVIGYRLASVYPRDRMYAVDPGETVRTDWLLDAIEETAFWEATAETETAVTLLVQYEQLDQVLELVERYPELDYVIDHMARAYADVPFDDPDFATFEDLAEYDNVLVKASALGLLSHEAFPFTDIEGHVRWMLDTFGRGRVAWGSDFPFVSSGGVEYADALACLDHFDSLSTSDRRWLTERAFTRFVGID
jgi:predicted TIM-barrel fold metal-dependent hydrolase